MLSMFWSMIRVFVDFLKYPLYFVLICILLILISCAFYYVKGLLKGKRVPKGNRRRLVKPSLLKKIFLLMPKQYIEDLFSRPADFFPYQGMIIFEGRQGSGKTISMVRYMKDMQYEFPDALCTTNLA